MAFNGSGTFNLASGNPVVTNTTISSTVQNNTLSDIATGLSNCVTRDGQSPATANLPMGSHKITGLLDGTSASDAASLSQVQSSVVALIGSISGADTITGTLSPALTAYAAGQAFRFVSVGSNTGAVTLNINSLGAKSITKLGTTALAANDIPSGAVVEVVYDGTQFQLVGLASSHATLADNATNSTNATNATTATNLASGSAGTLPYQSASGTTAMLAAGTSGNVLLSGGAGSPTWSATTGTGSVVKADSPTLTGTLTAATVNGTTMQQGGVAIPRMVLSTAQNTTSGTAIDFTGIPSWVKRVTVIFNSVSTNGTGAGFLVQIGSGSVTTSGYTSVGNGYNQTNSTAGFTSSAGFVIFTNLNANAMFATLSINLVSGSTYVSSHAGTNNSSTVMAGGGGVTLSGVLDRVRVTTTNGTDVFDLGSVNILYEG